MSRQQVSVVSRHVEKVALGAAAVAAVALIALYSAGQPYQVELQTDAGTQAVAPSDVGAEVESAARRLEQRLESQQVPQELAELRVADYVKVIDERLKTPVVAVQPIPLGEPGLAQNEFVVKGPEASRTVQVPPPPAPRDLVIRAGYGVLDGNADPQQLEQYVALVGDREPRDFRYVSVGGVVDLAEWQRQMNAVPLEQQLNASWQRSAMFVVDLTLERQQWDAAAREWGPAQVISASPGQLSFRGVQIKGHDEAEAVLQAIRDQQPSLLEPPFVPLAAGPAWQPPVGGVGELTAEENAKLGQLTKDIERLKKSIALYQQQVQLQQKRAAAPAAEGRPRVAARTGMTGDAESGSPDTSTMSPPAELSGGASRTPGKTRQTADDLLKEAQEQLTQKTDERQQILARLQAPSADVARTTPPAETDDSRSFWVHDVTVQAGATYRYRLVAQMVNPLFQRQQYLAPEQRGQAETLAIASAPSAWSESITIDPEYQVFVVAGSPEQKFVSAEVYRLRSGVWSRFSFSNLHPGDPLYENTADEATPPCESGLVLVDVLRSESGGTTGDTLALFLKESGELLERSVRQDAASAQRQRLANDQVLSELSKQPARQGPGPSSPSPASPGTTPRDSGIEAPADVDYMGPAGAG